MKIRENAVILFQGDSITDCGRSRENDKDLGTGYANFISAYLNATYPEITLSQGIMAIVCRSLNRWDDDCIDQSRISIHFN